MAMLRRPIFSILGAAKAATLDSDPPLIAAVPERHPPTYRAGA